MNDRDTTSEGEPGRRAAARPDDSARLISNAYAIAAQPTRLLTLLDEAERSMTQSETAVRDVDGHFEHAGDLIAQLSPLVGTDFGQFKPGTGASRAFDLELDGDLRVLSFDKEAFSGDGISVGKPVPDWVWDPVEMVDDQRRVRAGQGDDGPGFLRFFANETDEQGRWYTIRRETRSRSVRIGLRAVQFRWNASSGAQFASALGLTDTELALTRHLVDGGTVRSFAEKRGRSVGTARNQLKTLCRKLAVGSQQELLMLYTGFAHSLDLMESEERDTRHVCANIHREADGHRIAWEEHGDPDGDPVLYFHPFFEGALFTPEQDRAARQAGLRIIAPWRPLIGETTGDGKRLELVRGFARRLGPFLDHIGVERCAVLAAPAGTAFAAGFMQHRPDRVCGGVLAGSRIPYPTWFDLKKAGSGYGRALQMTRLAPAFARIYIRATLAGSLKGEFSAYIDDFFRDSPIDRAYYDDPTILETIRRSGTYTYIKTMDGPTEGILIDAFDWSDVCEGIEPEVIVAYGSAGNARELQLRRDFAKRFGFAMDEGYLRSAQLVMHDDPRRIFAHLRRIIDADE